MKGSTIRRVRAGTILTAALVTSFGLVAGAVPPASGAPPAAVVADGDNQARYLSAIQAKALRDIPFMISNAADGNHMNVSYAKLDKYDRGNTAWRQDYAAGILWIGGKVTDISATELKKVKARMPKTKNPYPIRSPQVSTQFTTAQVEEMWAAATAGRVTQQAPVECKGSSGYLYYRSNTTQPSEVYKWWNSCQTDLLLEGTGGAGLAGAIATAMSFAKKLGPLTGVIGAMLVVNDKFMHYAAKQSTIGAIYLWSRFPPGNMYEGARIEWLWLPQ